jgi:hypothetical protein
MKFNWFKRIGWFYVPESNPSAIFRLHVSELDWIGNRARASFPNAIYLQNYAFIGTIQTEAVLAGDMATLVFAKGTGQP